ncbi:MAG: hypothetical protein IAF02_19810 [Anaerolineae bacterium]|nr:hypothetical protein [Anaerolineae bacterium]
MLVFSPNNFGSFAPSDVRAREWLAAFQQLLVERPSTFATNATEGGVHNVIF